jgi:predicted Kef-type K+ transport protein
VINIAVGVASGVLFHLFLGPRDQIAEDDGESRLFVALAAAIVIASGAAYYLNLSPIYTNLILGFILANTGKAHTAARELLAGTERPVYLALLIFAGAAWSSAHVDLLYLAPVFVGLRLVARLIGGRVAGTLAAPAPLRSPSLGRALLAQGGIGVAIALNYGQVYPEQHADVVLTAAILSVLLFEVAAAAETSSFLAPPREEQDAGEETAVEAADGRADGALGEVGAS